MARSHKKWKNLLVFSRKMKFKKDIMFSHVKSKKKIDTNTSLINKEISPKSLQWKANAHCSKQNDIQEAVYILEECLMPTKEALWNF